MTTAVHIWWFSLIAVAIFNIAAWSVSAVMLSRRRDRFSPGEYLRRRWLLWLSAGYVAGCAFRSFLPRIDLERICLLESWLSSMVVGRSVATLAELCFMLQCALLLHFAGTGKSNRFTVTVSWMLIPLIVVAECASWYAILSTNYLGHFVENSIWTLCAILLLACFFVLWSTSSRRQRHFLIAMVIFAAGYILFMVSVDVPMYWSRWNEGLAAGTHYLTLLQGLSDASQPCVVSFDWQIWHEEIPWMTLYFTAAVWVSIALPHAPSWTNGLVHSPDRR